MADPAFDNKLRFAISVALSDDSEREAPWYGVWNLLLTEQLFKNFCQPPLFTITFPQYPLSREVDTKDDDTPPPKPKFEVSDDLQPNSGSGAAPYTPTGPRTQYIRDAAAPSPEERRALRSTLFRTPSPALQSSPFSSPLSAAPPSVATPNTTTPSAATPSAAEPGYQSTRIPDFAQIVFKDLGTEGNTRRHEKQILLIVEIKRFTPGPQRWNITDIFPQIDEQAYHAFKADETLQKLGAIIGVGHLWTYREYDRDSLLDDSPSVGSSASYRPGQSEPEQYVTWSEDYNEVEMFFKKKHAVLLSDDSNEAFRVIRARMKKLNNLS